MIYVTSDLHGFPLSGLLRLLNLAGFTEGDELIILGDASTLTRHPFYKKLYEYIESL